MNIKYIRNSTRFAKSTQQPFVNFSFTVKKKNKDQFCGGMTDLLKVDFNAQSKLYF